MIVDTRSGVEPTLKALAEPLRWQIIERLAGEALCVCQLVGDLGVVVTMGRGDACPVFPAKRSLDGELADPAGRPVEEVRPIVDDIDRQARAVLDELIGDGRGAPAGP